MPVGDLVPLIEAAEVSVIAMIDRPGTRPTPSDGQPLLLEPKVFSHQADDDLEAQAVRERAAQRPGCCQAILICLCCPCRCVADFSAAWRACCPGMHDCVCGAFGSIAGVASLALFYADVGSDALLALELARTSNPIWAGLTLAFISLQYFAAYLGVLLYLRSVYSAWSCTFVGFLLVGFPLGPLVLDVLMFLEPINLMCLLPSCGLLCLIPSSQLHYLLPAYRSTRTLLEVTLESLPQSILQAYIYYRLATAPEAAGSLSHFPIATLEVSLSLSVVSFLKAWIGAWIVARDQRMGVREYLGQQLMMGAGLPINALRRNAISEFICQFTLSDRQVEQLATALEFNTSLRRIQMGRLDLHSGTATLDASAWGDGDLESSEAMLIAAASTVPLLASLEEVTVDAGGPLPVKLLNGCTPATTVDLTSRRLGPHSARMVGALLRANRSATPRTLLLPNNNLTAHGDDMEGLRMLCGGITACRGLANINLSNNFICGAKASKGTLLEGIEAVAHAVEQSQSLTSLTLGNNRLGDRGASVLAAAMKSSALTAIDLCENGISRGGAKALSAAMGQMECLRTINLRSNAIDSEAIKPIASAMEASRSLTEVNLSNNFLRVRGTKELAAVVAKSGTLRSLNLANNALTDDGARALAPALAKSRTLVYLDARNNGLTADTKKLLKQSASGRGVETELLL